VDVSLNGTSIEPDADDIEAAYGAGVTPSDILTGKVGSLALSLLQQTHIAQSG
jgi:hypothetical protein